MSQKPEIHSDEELALLLSQELTVLDASITVSKPSPFQLEAMLTEHKRIQAIKLRHDLMLFLLAAVFILGLSAALLVRLPSLYFVLQAVTILPVLFFLVSPQRGKRDRRWGQ